MPDWLHAKWEMSEELNEELGGVRKGSANQVEYSLIEERFNIISHIVGGSLALIASVWMLVNVSLGVQRGRYSHPALAVFSISLYGIGLTALFVMSALYHAQPYGKTRRAVFRRFDHCMIAVLIAATYAPYMLIGMVQGGGSDLVWGIVIASIVCSLSGL